MMTLAEFTQIIKYIKSDWDRCREVGKAIELVNDSWSIVTLCPEFSRLVEYVFVKEFGESGYDTISWWLYEIPDAISGSFEDMIMGIKDQESHMSIEGKPVLLRTIEELYSHLNSDYYKKDVI